MKNSIFFLFQGPNSDVRYKIDSVSPPNSGIFFYIAPESGSIHIAQPVEKDKANSRYTVS